MGTASKYWLPPKRRTYGRKTKTLFHKTNYGPQILSSGEMIRGSGGAVGGGIYFAEKIEECDRKALSSGWIVKANVLTGKAKVITYPQLEDISFAQVTKHGFDSVELRGFNSGTEYIVYNKDQVELLTVFPDTWRLSFPFTGLITLCLVVVALCTVRLE